MPIYEYECKICGKTVEVIQKFSDAPLQTCQYCSGELNRLISHSSFHLKGAGWYVTDYASGSNKKTSEKKTENQAVDTVSTEKKPKESTT